MLFLCAYSAIPCVHGCRVPVILAPQHLTGGSCVSHNRVEKQHKNLYAGKTFAPVRHDTAGVHSCCGQERYAGHNIFNCMLCPFIPIVSRLEIGMHTIHPHIQPLARETYPLKWGQEDAGIHHTRSRARFCGNPDGERWHSIFFSMQ